MGTCPNGARPVLSHEMRQMAWRRLNLNILFPLAESLAESLATAYDRSRQRLQTAQTIERAIGVRVHRMQARTDLLRANA